MPPPLFGPFFMGGGAERRGRQKGKKCCAPPCKEGKKNSPPQQRKIKLNFAPPSTKKKKKHFVPPPAKKVTIPVTSASTERAFSVGKTKKMSNNYFTNEASKSMHSYALKSSRIAPFRHICKKKSEGACLRIPLV